MIGGPTVLFISNITDPVMLSRLVLSRNSINLPWSSIKVSASGLNPILVDQDTLRLKDHA